MVSMIASWIHPTMDEQTRNRIYQTVSLVAFLAAVGAMALLFMKSSAIQSCNIYWSACSYVAILGSLTTLVGASLGKIVKPIQALAIVFAILILLLFTAR